MAKWEKLGRIFSVDSPRCEWMQSHAANPVAELIDGDCYRVYFSTRDAKRRSSIGFVEFDLKEPEKILRVSETPVLAPGDVGLFDDSGVSMGCLIKRGRERWLYYLGWNLGVTVPWRNSIGLAVSKGPDQPFEKMFRVPVMDRSEEDPYSISYPFVFEHAGKFQMLYGSNLSWGFSQESMSHCIKQAESSDGIHWSRRKQIAIGFRGPDEYAMSKPSVIRDGDVFRAWYSYRGQSYRIGYAESQDGFSWTRSDDLVGIEPSSEGWDSESVEYPNVFEHKGRRYMLYNGNRYGLTGFGIAVQTEW